jgi:hypothetical protein
MTPPEELQASLGMHDHDEPTHHLQTHDVDPLVGERIRRRVTAVLRQEQRRVARPRSAWISLWYHRALEPTLLIGLGASYLVWAVQGTLAILH